MTDTRALDSMMRHLEEVTARHDELTAQMNDPAVASDPNRIVAVAKEQAKLARLVEPYRAYRRKADQLAETRQIIEDPAADPEFKALAAEETSALDADVEAAFERLKEQLVMGEDAAIDSVIMEIRAGTGGDEAALFARDLLEMYTRYAEAHGLKLEVLAASPSDLGGFREVVLSVKGPGAFQHLGYEGGGHRVQRVPETEAQGRIHTSAATVAVLPEPDQIDLDVDWERDVVEHVSRAGGPGGQNVNKVSSAIRLEHAATGITVSMRDEKSQHKNRAKARRILLTRLYDHFQQIERQKRASARKTMIGSGDRSQRIRTYNYPQNRVTDHRIGENFPLERVVAGEMDDLIAALQAYDKQQRLASLGD